MIERLETNAALLFILLFSACAQTPVFPEMPEEPRFRWPDAEVVASPDGGAIAGDPDSGAEEQAPLTWYRDIQPIVEARCTQCHGTPLVGGAPFSLERYEDTQQTSGGVLAQPIHELMAFRVTRSGLGRMPPNGQVDLTEEERAAIVRWSNSGAPAGTPPEGPIDPNPDPPDPEPDLPWRNGGSSPSPGPGLRWVDTFAHAPGNTREGVFVPQGSTSYLCFAFEVPTSTTGDRYAVRFEPFFDNAPNIHHFFVFHHRQDQGAPWSDSFDCLDNGFLALDPGDGVRRPEPIMTGWFPGRGPDATPPGVGIRVRPGDQLVLQVHYDSVPAGGIRDMSGVRVLLSSQPNLINSGEVWSGRIWGDALIADQNGQVAVAGTSPPLAQDVTVYRAVPHMHARGLSFRFEILRTGEADWRTLVWVPAWDFHNQVIYDLPPQDQLFRAGDRVRTTCIFDATERPVRFGEESENEMCFTMMNHYPLVYTQNAWIEQ